MQNGCERTEDFKEKLFRLVGEDYELCGEYLNFNTKVDIRHKNCNTVFSVYPGNILYKGTRCSSCSKRKRRTTESFKQEILSLCGDEYEVLSEFKGTSELINMKHKKCGRIFSMRPSNFLYQKNRCPFCNGKFVKSTEQFINEVKILEGDEYEVRSEYINAKTYVLMFHSTCGSLYQTTPTNFLSGSRCPECFRNYKKTTEEFKEQVFEKVQNEYKVISEYENAQKKLRMKHEVCGHEYEVTPNDFLQGRRCPKCNKKPKKNTEVYKQEIYDKHGDDYTILAEYINIDTPIYTQHNVCGYKWYATPTHLLNKPICPNCANNIKRSHTDFINEVEKLVNDEYSVLEFYINTNSPIKIRHNECGFEYPVAPKNFLRGDRCPRCMHKKAIDKQRKTSEEFIQELDLLTNGEFVVKSEYMGAYHPIVIEHKGCNGSFMLSSARNILVHPKCRICDTTESSGKIRVRRFLEKRGWNYKTEYRFNDCRDHYPLPFDFAVMNNEKVIFLIEFDGQHHYFPISIFGGIEAFKDRQKKDEIKNDYCQKNYIPLLRIPYYDIAKTEEIIDEFVQTINCEKSLNSFPPS